MRQTSPDATLTAPFSGCWAAAIDVYLSGFSRRRSSFSTASRINTAKRRLPTNASIRRIVSTGSLIVVAFIPSGGRPIPS